MIDSRDVVQKVPYEAWSIWYQKARMCLKDNVDM